MFSLSRDRLRMDHDVDVDFRDSGFGIWWMIAREAGTCTCGYFAMGADFPSIRGYYCWTRIAGRANVSSFADRCFRVSFRGFCKQSTQFEVGEDLPEDDSLQCIVPSLTFA
jgi:hypothetical protein